YDSAHDSIDAGRYDRAIDQLDRLISQYEGRPDPMANRVDAAMYWKAYAQMKESAFKEAQATLESLQQKFADSRWLKDAKALSVEVQQAAGQRVSPDAQNDEEIKLLALRGLMQADPDRALPMIEQILAGNSSVRVKENALFVLSQSRDPRTRGIITSVARGGNPDLQLRAVRYLGAMRTPESRQSLQEIYRSTTDAAVKRSILQAYQNSDSIDQLSEIAKNEKDPQIRRQAIRYIGAMQRRNAGSSELLKSLYNAESDLDIKKEIVSSLASGQNAATLVELAKAEKNPEATRYIVSRLSTMKSKEATDYMVELLK
ncbi:MAG TPA: HEAT repeat domain-containing protein, partial [Vicinamibacterales bacterium]|nr:HEAT repeat domain-containing protein [Vicinamibacterales bacterium]